MRRAAVRPRGRTGPTPVGFSLTAGLLCFLSCLLLIPEVSALPARGPTVAFLPEQDEAEKKGTEKQDTDKKGAQEKKDNEKKDEKKEKEPDERLTREQREREKKVRRLEASLKSAISRKSYDEMAQLLESIGSMGTRRGDEIVLRVGERYTEDPVRGAVLNALIWSRHSPACLNYFVTQLANPGHVKVERLIILVEVLDRIDGEVAAEGLIHALVIPDTRVITGAVRALRHKPSRKAVQAVVRLFGKVAEKRDLLAAETRITLITLTGEKYERYEDWANWWLTHKDTWKPPTRAAKAAERRARTAVHRPARDYDIPKLFGQEVASKRVVFVIDTSSSMARKDPFEGEEGSGGGSRVRIERAQRELIRVVTKLRPDVHFNIVAYNTYAYPWKKDGLVRASKGHKRQAIQFIGGWKPEGHTNILEAMQVAMESAEPDTVILLSDGSPTIPGVGSLAEIAPILEAIRKDNRFKKITIHTLGFPGCKLELMKALAADSGGTYAQIK